MSGPSNVCRAKTLPLSPRCVRPVSHSKFQRIALVVLVLVAGLSGTRAATADESYGLFFKGSEADTVWVAPLLNTDIDIAINGNVVRTTVRQHFVNTSDRWLEGTYIFPLPEQAAVDTMLMRIDDRFVKGEIKPREEAQAIYDQAAAEGKHASLVSSERPNIFTTSVANIGPGQIVAIEIGFQDSVRYRDGIFELRMPLVVAPRYIPGDPLLALVASLNGESDIPPGGTAEVPDAANIVSPIADPIVDGSINPVTINVTLNAGFAIDRIDSPTHAIVTELAEPARAEIRPLEPQSPADRDFVLEWTATPHDTPIASMFEEQRNGETFLMVQLLPPDDEIVDHMPRDVTFIIDTSGSMAGTSMQQARNALRYAVERLTPDDRFNIIRFASDMSALFEQRQAWTPETLDQALDMIAGLNADGGTEMQPALMRALREPAEPGRLSQIVFLTDAAVGNEAALFDTIARQLDDHRLFTVGIGSAPNSYFMRRAAELGRGSFTYINDVNEVGERMATLLEKLEAPAVTELAIEWPAIDPASVTLYPDPLPDLYRGEPIWFTARLPAEEAARFDGSFRLSGQQGSEPWSLVFGGVSPVSAEGIAAIWARRQLITIEDGRLHGVPDGEVRRAATDLAMQYSLVSAYTSLVAVEQEIVRPEDAVLMSTRLPINLPAGWDREKWFGFDDSGSPDSGPLPAGMREAALPDAMQPGALPIGATAAQWQMVTGLGTILLAAMFFIAGRRRPHHA